MTRSPFLTPCFLQHIGEAADLLVQFRVGDVPRDGRIVAFPDDRGLIGALRQMPVDAIHRDIGRAVLEPFDRDIMRVEARMLHLREGRDPVDALRLLGPEAVRILERAFVEPAIGLFVDAGALFPVVGDGVEFLGHCCSDALEFVMAGLDPAIHAVMP